MFATGLIKLQPPSLRLKVSALFALVLISATYALTPTSVASAQDGLDDVLNSEAMRRIGSRSQRPKPSYNKKTPAHLISNYNSIWAKREQPSVLLTWLGIRIPNFTADIKRSSLNAELARADAELSTRDGVKVIISVLVPSPTYITMAEYKTLADFNQFRPPALDVVAEQSLDIQGLQAMYYRSREGACSLLFNTTKYSIVNLRTKRCADANVMVSIAKALNFQRLNDKLNS